MSGLADRRIIRRVVGWESADDEVELAGWPFTMPAVAQVLSEGLELAPGVTFLAGENGTGKSTLVEAIAMAYGLSPEGGSTGAYHSSRTTESPLHKAIRLERSAGHRAGASSSARRRCTASTPISSSIPARRASRSTS